MRSFLKFILLIIIASLMIGCGSGQSEVKGNSNSKLPVQQATGRSVTQEGDWFAKMNEAAKKGETVHINVKDLGEFKEDDRRQMAKRVLKSGAVEIGPMENLNLISP